MTAAPSARAHALAEALNAALDRLVATVAAADPARWSVVPAPETWSIGKEVEHVAEAAAYHQWIVRLTIGEKVASRIPVLERSRMTTALAPAVALELLAQRHDEGVRLIGGLSDEQLDLPTRPPRGKNELLAETIRRVLIGHVDQHEAEIRAKAQASGGRLR